MRLKSFVTASLPNRKGKKNKTKISKLQSPTEDKWSVWEESPPPSPIYDNLDVLTPKVLQKPRGVSTFKTKRNPAVVTDDFYYLNERQLPLDSKQYEEKYNNLNTYCDDSKWICNDKLLDHTPDIKRKPRTISLRQDTDRDSVYSGSLQRIRTRIKTNPWLPSPCSTPVLTPGTSPRSSISPMLTPEDDDVFHSANLEVALGNIRLRPPLPKWADEIKSSNVTRDGRQYSNVMRRSTAYSDSDNSITANEAHPLSALVTRCSISSSDNEDLKEVKQCTAITPEPRVSFKYEEDFEERIEATIDDFAGSCDSLSDGYCSRDELFLRSRRKPLKGHQYRQTIDVDSPHKDYTADDECEAASDSESDDDFGEQMVWRKRRDYHDADTDDTLCEDSGRTEDTISPLRETNVDEVCLKTDSIHRRDTKDSLSNSSSIDSGAYSGAYSMDSADLISPGNEHPPKSNLQSKVDKLRQDKLIVDEKIRAARAEEVVWQRERLRFQNDLTLHRKQMLKRTLQDLKQKLDNQSQRLQNTYSTVLNIQKTIIKRDMSPSNRRMPLQRSTQSRGWVVAQTAHLDK